MANPLIYPSTLFPFLFLQSFVAVTELWCSWFNFSRSQFQNWARSWISFSFVGLNISFGILRWLARQHNAIVLGQECRPSMATSVLFISTHSTDSWFDSPLRSALWDPVTTLRLVSFDSDMGSPCLRAADDKVSTKNAAFAWTVDYILGQS